MRDALKELMKPEIEEEKRKNQNEIASNMIRDGKLDDQDIAKYTGLEVSDVQKLREELTVKV